MKKYLDKIYALESIIKSKKRTIETLNDMATNCTSTISDMPSIPTRNVSKLENVVIKIVDMKNEVEQDIAELMELKLECLEKINKLDDRTEKYILEERYINNKRWSEIAKELSYSLRYIYKVHDRAIQKLDTKGH